MTSPEDTLPSMRSVAENSGNLMGGSGSKLKKNGSGVSDVKKDGGGSVDAAVVSERVVETESIVESSEEDKFGDGDLNSVSKGDMSVSGDKIDVGVGVVGNDEKMKDNKRSCTDNGGIEGGDCKELNANGTKGQANGEKLEESDHGFRVGDLVWSKIKSNPWWPGQIYDSKDASEFAMKYSQEGRLLVAFFGDGSCSWCLPSQLIPFVENFKEMSMESSSRNFHKAIQGALDEVCRLAESDMTCKCVSLEKRDGCARLVVENAGLKPGVLAPEVDIHRLSVPSYEPAEILSKLTQFAKVASVESAVEIAVLKSSLSAFYRAKGGYWLPEYHDPVYIEGLEDKIKDESADNSDLSCPIKFLGPRVGPNEASPNVLAYQKKKQKSVAELMGANTDIRSENRKRATVKESKDVGKSPSSPKRKKRDHGEIEEGGSEGASKTMKVAVSKPTIMTNEKGSKAENSGDEDIDGKQKKSEVVIAKSTSARALGELEMVSTPRERKKSKYLSPPYTDPRWKMGSSSTKIESKQVKITKTDRGGEHRTKASEDLGSQPLSKIIDEVTDDKLPIRKLKGLEKPCVDATPTVENDKKMMFPASDVSVLVTSPASDVSVLVTSPASEVNVPVMHSASDVSVPVTFSASDVNVPVSEVLSEIRSAAVNPLDLSNNGSLDTVRGFVSAYRSSTQLLGSGNQILQKCKGSKKRKSTPSWLQDQENEPESAHKKKTPRAEKIEEKPDTSKSEKASKIPNAEEKLEGNASSSLILTFTPEYPLPSKEEIVKLFGKFGSLNVKETSVITDSHAVQIAYMKDSDAEAAFESSINESPFGIENVNYWLQHGSKPRGAFLPPIELGPEKTESPDDFMSDVRAIRQKIEIMTVILGNYHYKFSTEDKASLKHEMKHLRDSMETAMEKINVIAEKTSSSSP